MKIRASHHYCLNMDIKDNRLTFWSHTLLKNRDFRMWLHHAGWGSDNKQDAPNMFQNLPTLGKKVMMNLNRNMLRDNTFSKLLPHFPGANWCVRVTAPNHRWCGDGWTVTNHTTDLSLVITQNMICVQSIFNQNLDAFIQENIHQVAPLRIHGSRTLAYLYFVCKFHCYTDKIYRHLFLSTFWVETISIGFSIPQKFYINEAVSQ